MFRTIPWLFVAACTGGGISSITVTPLELVPAFSPEITDYYVRCSDGTQTVGVDVDGSTELHMIAPDDLIQIDQYSIRCLPPTFPELTIDKPGTPTPGYYLVNSAPFVYVLDGNGVPVWYEPTHFGCNVSSPAPNTIAYMADAEYPYSKDTMPFYEIHDLASGDVRMLASADEPTDEHELQLDNGNYLFFTDPLVKDVDLTSIGLAGSYTIADCKIVEVDPSGALVWSWAASEHLDVAESVYQQFDVIGTGMIADIFHCNSIEIGPNNDLLISMRHTSAIYDLDRTTGNVSWKLGGNSVTQAPHLTVVGDPDGGFNLQHDARFTATGNLTLFDDHGIDPTMGVARGLELSLDHTANTASIVWQARADQTSMYMGGFRRYSDGDSLISWGYLVNETRIFTEYDADANPVFEVSTYLPTVFNALTYRTVKVPPEQFDIELLRASTAR
ncbi:MAG: arylsulfotransferase family protein [Kofleriaceae bacterium]